MYESKIIIYIFRQDFPKLFKQMEEMKIPLSGRDYDINDDFYIYRNLALYTHQCIFRNTFNQHLSLWEKQFETKVQGGVVCYVTTFNVKCDSEEGLRKIVKYLVDNTVMSITIVHKDKDIEIKKEEPQHMKQSNGRKIFILSEAEG